MMWTIAKAKVLGDHLRREMSDAIDQGLPGGLTHTQALELLEALDDTTSTAEAVIQSHQELQNAVSGVVPMMPQPMAPPSHFDQKTPKITRH